MLTVRSERTLPLPTCAPTSREEDSDYPDETSILMRPDADLKAFEISQIGNLLPETAAQAKTLIPS